MFKLMVLSVLCLTTNSGISAARKANDPPLLVRLDQVANSYTAGNAFMGSVLVVRGDQTLLNKGYGMANLEWSIANAPDVKFRLGSLAKQFTATLVLLLQQDGKLRVEDPVNRYLPDAPKTWDKITLAELLGHTSGIPEIQSDPHFRTWCMSAHTHAEELALFRDRPLDFEPGGRFEYSNSNYLVLGAVIEKVSGESYGDLLSKRIFRPLGMKDSGVDTDELILPKRAQGYMAGNGGLLRARSESMSVPWSAGSIYSTTTDLLRWEHGLFDGKLLSAASLRAMMTPGKGEYGFGVIVTEEDGAKVVDHNGAIEGFVAHMAYVPERRIAVIVLSNVFGGAPPAMGNQLVEVALGIPVILASERKAVPIAEKDLAKFVGTYQMSSGMSFTFAASGNTLRVNAGGTVVPLLYEGVKAGHPRFYVRMVDGEIEFVPDPTGAMTTVLWHQHEGEQSGKRRLRQRNPLSCSRTRRPG
jgi:CubicO group peptidase (beta-lactamase class C family)